MRARIIAVLVTGTVFALGSIFPGPAWTQGTSSNRPDQDTSLTPIGKVVKAQGVVAIEHVNAVVVQASLGNQATTKGKVGDPVYLNDVVQTGPDGSVGIAFADGTAFNLSSNARITLNEFVYDPKGTSNSTLFTLAKGSFTLIAGNIAKTGDMKIDTPVATMGIRGTTPHVEISDDGTVKFTTLIEKGKNEVLEKYGPVTVKPDDTGASAQERDKPNLQICKGC